MLRAIHKIQSGRFSGHLRDTERLLGLLFFLAVVWVQAAPLQADARNRLLVPVKS